MLHMQSREFREEFLSLVRNDEIHIRLFSLHLYLLNERLQSPMQGAPSFPSKDYLALKRAQLTINSRRFPRHFMYHAYSVYHSHLPEELFFDDFVTFFKKANAQVFRGLQKGFEGLEEEPDNLKPVREAISK